MQNTLYRSDHFVDYVSRNQYCNVLQRCKTDLILEDEGQKEPVLRQQFFVFATEGRYRSAIFNVSGKKNTSLVLRTSAYTSEFCLCDFSRNVFVQVLALLFPTVPTL